MNQRIVHLIRNPFEVQLSDVALLQDEIEKFPYFSNLRVLLLFALKEYGHSSYQKELEKTSICCPSRVALYHYLQKKSKTTDKADTETAAPVENVSETVTEAVPEPEEPQITEPEAETIRKEIQTEETAADEPSAVTVTEPEVEPQKIGPDTEMSFSEWLNVSGTQKSDEEKTPTEKDIKFRLIDEFIEKSPKISPIEKSISQESGVQKQVSQTEYTDLMTETLAQIYVDQRKYDKAVRAYRILSLKYPEKKEFFEDQIRKIKDLGG